MSTDQHTDQPRDLAWFKSSYSGTSGGDCVEVAVSPAAVHVRDSKNVARAYLSLGRNGWVRFVSSVAHG